MARCLKERAAKPEDQSSVPGSHGVEGDSYKPSAPAYIQSINKCNFFKKKKGGLGVVVYSFNPGIQ